MRQFHSVKVRVFVKWGEDAAAIEDGLLLLFPFDLKTEKIPILRTTAATFENRTVDILEVIVTKERHIRLLLNAVKEQLSAEDTALLLEQLPTRIDAEQNFFFRLEKHLLLHNEFVITEGGDCYHFTCHVATYPKNLATAQRIVKQFLTS